MGDFTAMRTKHFLFVLLSAFCLLTAWAQPFEDDIRQTADYKQAAIFMPVLVKDYAGLYRTNMGMRFFSGENEFAELKDIHGDVILEVEDGVGAWKPIAFLGTNNALHAQITRGNFGLGLPALTNTSNVTMMRALAGSTNTNQPFSGSIAVGTNTLLFTNGILREVQ